MHVEIRYTVDGCQIFINGHAYGIPCDQEPLETVKLWLERSEIPMILEHEGY